jgi:hypothetical protein
MVTLLMITRFELSVIVPPASAEAKRIVAPEAASAIACLNDPGPLSARVVTTTRLGLGVDVEVLVGVRVNVGMEVGVVVAVGVNVAVMAGPTVSEALRQPGKVQ